MRVYNKFEFNEMVEDELRWAKQTPQEEWKDLLVTQITIIKEAHKRYEDLVQEYLRSELK